MFSPMFVGRQSRGRSSPGALTQGTAGNSVVSVRPPAAGPHRFAGGELQHKLWCGD